MRLDVDVTGRTGAFEGMYRRAVDPRVGLLAASEAFYARQRRVFATGGYGRWAALDEDTVAAKGSDRILVDTGGLLLSLTTPGARYSVREITRDGIRVGSKNPVGNLLRTGARGTPVRDPVPPTTPAERAAIARELAVFITSGLAA